MTPCGESLEVCFCSLGLEGVQSGHFSKRGFCGFLRDTLLVLGMFPLSALVSGDHVSVGILDRTVKEKKTDSVNLRREFY